MSADTRTDPVLLPVPTIPSPRTDTGRPLPADAVGLPARAASATVAEVLAATEPAIAEIESGPDWLETRARRDLLRALRRRRRDLGG